jgi:hypothetical protein
VTEVVTAILWLDAIRALRNEMRGGRNKTPKGWPKHVPVHIEMRGGEPWEA